MAPQIIPFNFGEDPVNAGDMTSIQCTVNKGDFPITIEWYFNNIRLEKMSFGILISVTSKRISTLSIESITAQHGGLFTCVASNNAGNTNYTSELIVNGIIWCLFNFILDI